MPTNRLCAKFGQIILASASARRAQILSQVGFDFKIVPSRVQETFNGEPPEAQAVTLAREKALDVAEDYGNSLVLAADTIVALDGKVLGKPESPAEAREMLHFLSGRMHEVFTGFAIVQKNARRERSRVERTRVRFRPLRDDEIDAYIETGTCFDKAGSYGIQDVSAVFCDYLEGDFYNVVGLPIASVFREMEDLVTS